MELHKGWQWLKTNVGKSKNHSNLSWKQERIFGCVNFVEKSFAQCGAPTHDPESKSLTIYRLS